MHEAFYVARTGRPGPVVVDLPKDIQFAEAEYVAPELRDAQVVPPSGQAGPRKALEEAVAAIAKGEKADLLLPAAA